jgi:hypothetical protein
MFDGITYGYNDEPAPAKIQAAKKKFAAAEVVH